jgi:hypothetical protein
MQEFANLVKTVGIKAIENIHNALEAFRYS